MLFLITCYTDGVIRRFIAAAGDRERALVKVQRLAGADCFGAIAVTELSDFLTDVAELPRMVKMVEIAASLRDAPPPPDWWDHDEAERVIDDLVKAAAMAEDYYNPDELERYADELDGPSNVAGYDKGDLRRKAELLEVPHEY